MLNPSRRHALPNDRPPPRPPRASRAAFSLIEVMLVVVLMGLLAGMAMTYLTPNSEQQLISAAEVVSTDIDYVRNLAVTYNSNYRLTFDLTNKSYALTHTGTNTSLNTLPSSPLWTTNAARTTQTTFLDRLPGVGQARLHGIYSLAGATSTSTTTLEFNSLGGSTNVNTTQIWLAVNDATSPTGSLYLSLIINPVTGLSTTGTVQTTTPTTMSGPTQGAAAFGS